MAAGAAALAAVKIDATEVNQLGILARIQPTGAKPDLPSLFVDSIDTAYDPSALRDLVRGFPCFHIDEIQVPPTVPLG